MLENKKKVGDKLHVAGGDFVMFLKFLRVSWNCYVERTQNQRIPKQVARAAMEVAERREKPQKKRETKLN